MIILNENSQEETKSRFEKREKIKTYFQGIIILHKDREKYSSELTKKMETLSRLSTRIVNKRINHIKSKNIDLTKESK